MLDSLTDTRVEDIAELYDIGKELGVGKFSTVMQGTHKDSGQLHALMSSSLLIVRSRRHLGLAPRVRRAARDPRAGWHALRHDA